MALHFKLARSLLKSLMPSHKWTFKSRFRTNAYGWKGTELATKRLKEAVSEIKKAYKTDAAIGGDGAVSLMERIWPSLQGIDGSSGALGNAVNRTLEALIPLVIDAPVDTEIRRKWLARLYEAILEDGVDYLAPVEDRWGELCCEEELAAEWADQLLPIATDSWSKEETHGSWVNGQSICLSCLLTLKRFDDLQVLLSLKSYRFWSFDKFWAKALVQQGEVDAAIEFAESCRSHLSGYDHPAITAFCEQTLIDAGRVDEAYDSYAMLSPQASTHLATFRQIARRYPGRDVKGILSDLIDTHPPRGKWFAATKDADCLDLAIECAMDKSAEPGTLIRAARDFSERVPSFSAEIALCAIRNLLAGGGYEPTNLDLTQAHRYLMAGGQASGREEWVDAELAALTAKGAAPGREGFLELLLEERARTSEARSA